MAVFIVCLTAFLPMEGWAQNSEQPLRFLGMIQLPGVTGRIDHLAIDREGQRLFVAALGNNSLEIVDLRQGSRITTIRGLNEPQGVFYDAAHRKVYVSNGGDGTVRIYDAGTFRSAGVLSLSGDADNLRFDERAKRLYVGYGEGGIGVVDIEHQKKTGDIALAAHPEAFALETNGPRIFINVPGEKRIAVADRIKGANIADWPVACGQNFPLALDEKHHRLFVGCRAPSEVLVYDTVSGQETSAFAINRDADDLFYDPSSDRLFVSCGDGTAIVFSRESPDRYRQVALVKTRSGARTSLFVAETHRWYVAAPRSGNAMAAIMVYEDGP